MHRLALSRRQLLQAGAAASVLTAPWAAAQKAAATPLPAGSFMFHPAGGVHWDGSNSDSAAVVQIIDMGPVTSADVDPALESWVVVGG